MMWIGRMSRRDGEGKLELGKHERSEGNALLSAP
jgi:hypothetical protein